MSANTKIEWTHSSWNPITGCSKISIGCKNCYAERMANRLKGRYGYPELNPFEVIIRPYKFYEPSKWKKPRMIFVCSMGDLFHNDVAFCIITELFAIMNDNIRHIFQILTKRPHRLIEWLKSTIFLDQIPDHIWIGVTCENQRTADERIPLLASIPCKVKYVSFEPLLSAINLKELYKYFNWVIVGGETGPKSRKMNLEWAESLRDQAIDYNIPFFFKQTGDWYKQNKSYCNFDSIFPREFPLQIQDTKCF